MWCNGVPRLLKLTYLAAGCGAFFVVWGMFFLRSEPPRVLTLQEKWNDAIRELPPISPGPRVVKTDRILPNPPLPDFGWVTDIKKIDPPVVSPSPVVEKPQQIIEKPQRSRRIRSEDRVTRSEVCSAHGMRKVITNGGKSWRCRK